MAHDTRSPILYLRSFQDDTKGASTISLSTYVPGLATEEEQLALSFGEIGPFVAIGRPGEGLPELGAARTYVSGDEWQNTVISLMDEARLVILRAAATEGFLWEVEQATKRVDPQHLIFAVPKDKIEYQRFVEHAQPQFPHPLPDASVIKPKSFWKSSALESGARCRDSSTLNLIGLHIFCRCAVFYSDVELYESNSLRYSR